eukprot:7310705-Pyramimonas_sp.AAC.1
MTLAQPLGRTDATSSASHRNWALKTGTERRRPWAVPQPRTKTGLNNPWRDTRWWSCARTSSSSSQSGPRAPA